MKLLEGLTILLCLVASSALNVAGDTSQARFAAKFKTMGASNCDLASISAVTPDQPTYQSARLQFASDMSTPPVAAFSTNPDGIVFCSTESCVRDAVTFAKNCNFRVSVRSGGHQYRAYSSCDVPGQCLQIDVGGLNQVTISGTTVTAGVGARLGPLLERLASNSPPLTVPTGLCLTVGVGGHYQSSALGYLGRSFGSGIDLVKSFRLVTADGNLRTIDRQSDPELYWALLGGCPGAFGVVTSYTWDAIDASEYPESTMFRYIFPYSREAYLRLGQKHLDFSNALNNDGLNDLTTTFLVTPLSAPWTTHFIVLEGIWVGVNGQSFNDIKSQYLQPFFTEDTPVIVFELPLPLPQAQAAIAVAFQHPGKRYHFHQIGMYTIPDIGFVSRVADAIEARIANGLFSVAQMYSAGGQFSLNAGLNSAWGDRREQYAIDDWVFFQDNVGEEVKANFAVETMRTLETRTSMYWRRDNGGGSQHWMSVPTHVDLQMFRDWQHFYPSQQFYRRLRNVKTRVDPNDLFHTNMTVPTLPGK